MPRQTAESAATTAPQAEPQEARTRRSSRTRRGTNGRRSTATTPMAKIEALISQKREEIKTLKILLRMSRKIDGLR